MPANVKFNMVCQVSHHFLSTLLGIQACTSNSAWFAKVSIASHIYCKACTPKSICFAKFSVDFEIYFHTCPCARQNK